MRGAAHAWGVCCAGGVCCVPVGTVLRVHTDTHCTRSARVVYVCCACLCGCVQIHTRVLCGCCVLCVWGALCTIYGVCVCIYVCMPMYLYCTRSSLYTYIPSPCHTHSEHNRIYHTHTYVCTHTVQKVYSVCWVWYSVCVCGSVYYVYCVFMLCELRVQHFALHHRLPRNPPRVSPSKCPKQPKFCPPEAQGAALLTPPGAQNCRSALAPPDTAPTTAPRTAPHRGSQLSAGDARRTRARGVWAGRPGRARPARPLPYRRAPPGGAVAAAHSRSRGGPAGPRCRRRRRRRRRRAGSRQLRPPPGDEMTTTTLQVPRRARRPGPASNRPAGPRREGPSRPCERAGLRGGAGRARWRRAQCAASPRRRPSTW